MSQNEVRVVPVTRLREVRGIDGEVVVVDATGSTTPLPLLARAVRLRRVLRATGGDLVLAAGQATVQLLWRSGLHRSLPYCADLATAIGMVGTAPAGEVPARIA